MPNTTKADELTRQMHDEYNAAMRCIERALDGKPDPIMMSRVEWRAFHKALLEFRPHAQAAAKHSKSLGLELFGLDSVREAEGKAPLQPRAPKQTKAAPTQNQ